MSNKNNSHEKPLEFYLDLNYPITLYPEEEGGFTVEIRDLPGCLSQGETVEEAFEMIAEARELWLGVAHEYGDPIPMPSTEVEYSGKTMLRMPKYLHAKLAESAKREDCSLNQYIVTLLSERDALGVVKEVRNELADIRRQAQKKERSPYLVGESVGELSDENSPYVKSEQKSQS